MVVLETQTLPLLEHKNLLAFSAGVDSTALFFVLLHKGIDFDIALVNYQTRPSSNAEEAYALQLAKQYNKTCYTTKAPPIEHHFEKNARDFRYGFFETLIEKHRYDNLIMAHQLNDQLEWLLMRLTKGAGVMELVGLETISKRPNYTLIRPILHHTKEELLAFLKEHAIEHFVDESNFESRFERNYFRIQFANRLIEQFPNGIKQSMEYLKQDKALLGSSFQEIFRYKELVVLEYFHHAMIPKAVDTTLKTLGYLMSGSQRAEVGAKSSVVLGGIWAIEYQEGKIFIAPYLNVVMPKEYKELCRVHKIPTKVRPYLYQGSIVPNVIKM
ncbi:MAG: tRNA(Ile)-lysidine synthetase [Sulfurovum sp. PC08-66]|nr:MAG: tRNA(Ile)-lysidine synthetase [Sulfurovum sp. PC08-66]